MPDEGLLHANRSRLARMKKNPRWVGCKPRLFRLLAPNGNVLLQWRPWKGMSLQAATLVKSIPGGRPVGCYSYWEDEVKRRTQSDEKPFMRPVADLSSVMLSGVPTLLEHLAHTAYDDGGARKLGEVRIRVQGVVWAVQVTDVDTATFFQATAPKIDDAISLAALMLACDDCPWEPALWLIKNSKKK